MTPSSSLLALALYTLSLARAVPTGASASNPSSPSSTPSLPNCHAPTKLLYSFPANSTFIENVAIAANNDILFTDLRTPTVYSLTPSSPHPSPSVVATFPSPNSGVSGIAEIFPGIYAVAIGVWNISGRVAHEQSVWTIDTNVKPAKKTFIRAYPNSTNLDGVAPLKKGWVVIADADAGGIYTLDVPRNASNFYTDDSLSPDGPPPLLGVNGIRVLKGYMYYLNTARGTYGRFPIDKDGVKNGPAEVIFTNPNEGLYGIDDFVLDKKGDAWIATHPNSVIKVTSKGTESIVAQGAILGPIGPTAVGFARSGWEKGRILYSVQADGTIVAIDTKHC